MTTEEKIYHYIYLKAVRIDNEYIDHYNYMQTSSPDPSDYLESIILFVRREMFWETANELHSILHIT